MCMIRMCMSLCSYQAERKLREAHLKTQINRKLEESGERERQGMCIFHVVLRRQSQLMQYGYMLFSL